jgi:hypothetical protein
LLLLGDFFTTLNNYFYITQKSRRAGLKKNKFNVFCAWVLLICFAAGQSMIYIHQHNIIQKTGIVKSLSKNQPKPATSVTEKCYMCDVMHHSAMTINQQTYFSPVVVTGHLFKVGDYDFISIALVLSAGRAPPGISYSC